MIKKTIPVVGMACSACSAHVERKLNSLPGIQSASVSLPGRSARVEFDEKEISLEQMKREINAIGYDLVIESDRSVEEIERNAYRQLKRKTLLS
ncbi:MAG: heavy-metal-associated domain-containing protein, partial [Prevotella buccalis]|nr:heavy-metal-associated domain-containing protein [Hoylesella buccalis]